MKRKIIIIISAAVVLVAAALTVTLVSVKKINDRTVNVAFYDLPDSIVQAIQDYIPREENIKINYAMLPAGEIDVKSVCKKYDAIFTWKGQVTSQLESSAQNVPEKILARLPVSLKNKKCLPILLDHYEMSFYKPVQKKIDENIPSTPEELTAYLDASRDKVFSPYFTSGADNRNLLAFLGAYVESLDGLEAYNALIEAASKAQSLEDFIDTPLTKDDTPLTVRLVLDEFRDWPSLEYIHPMWHSATQNDLIFFCEQNQIGVFSTFLSTHRRIKYNVIRDFQACRFPISADKDHGLIAPAVSAVILSGNSNIRNYLDVLVSPDIQDALSSKTMLAPVEKTAQAYDVQSDDVRFWAASCKGGALPDLATACYQTNSEKLAKIAGEIRDYLKKIKVE